MFRSFLVAGEPFLKPNAWWPGGMGAEKKTSPERAPANAQVQAPVPSGRAGGYPEAQGGQWRSCFGTRMQALGVGTPASNSNPESPLAAYRERWATRPLRPVGLEPTAAEVLLQGGAQERTS